MLRNLRKIPAVKNSFSLPHIQKQTFLTNDYKCSEDWKSQTSSPILSKVKLNDFYNVVEQNFLSKGVISAIDVDIFAHASNDPMYLEELKNLLHKLRLSAETGSTLESTHHATVRNYIEFDHVEELVEMLQDPLNFGLFLDDFTANILLDKLIVSQKYELAVKVASTIMLQEDYSNDITCALCQFACFKYVTTPRAAPEPVAPAPLGKPKKVEEIKIRVKFLRNPYFDDHFDIKDVLLLSGKTLAWISERYKDNFNNNLQMLGWLMYKKYDKLLAYCENFAKSPSSKVHNEVIEQMKTESNMEAKSKEVLDKCILVLGKVNSAEISLEESLKIVIENAINKVQNSDISKQKQVCQILFSQILPIFVKKKTFLNLLLTIKAVVYIYLI